MIKFTMRKRNGRRVFGMGLSDVNVDRLKRGQPILVQLDQLDEAFPAEVVIFHGTTERAIEDKLMAYGLIGPETEYRGELGEQP